MPHLINHKTLAYTANGEQELLMRPSHLSSCWIVRGPNNLIFFLLATKEHLFGQAEHRKKGWTFKLLSLIVLCLSSEVRCEGGKILFHSGIALGLGTSSIMYLQFTTQLSPGNQEGQSRCIFCLTWPLQHVSLSYLTQCLLPKLNFQERNHYPTQKWPRKSK